MRLRLDVIIRQFGMVRTAHWHTHFDVRTCVYGLLHISRNTVYEACRSKKYPSATRGSGAASGHA